MNTHWQVLIILSLNFASLTWAADGNPSGAMGGEAPYVAGGSLRYSMGLNQSLQMIAKYDQASIPSFSLSSKAEAEFQNGISFDLEVRKLGVKSFGYIGTINIDLPRNQTKETLTSGNSKLETTSQLSKLQAITFLTDAAYRWNRIYVPLGLNYALFNYTAKSGFSGSSTVSGGIGFQIGLGVYAVENFAILAQYRMTAISTKLTSNSGVVDNYGSGYLTSQSVSLKYLF